MRVVTIFLVSIFLSGYFTEAFDTDSFDFGILEKECFSMGGNAFECNNDHRDAGKTAKEGHDQFGFTPTLLLRASAVSFESPFHQIYMEYRFTTITRAHSVLKRPPKV